MRDKNKQKQPGLFADEKQNTPTTTTDEELLSSLEQPHIARALSTNPEVQEQLKALREKNSRFKPT